MEKDGRKILMGFSGSLDSVVGAYLLKRQGFEVIAVGIVFDPGEEAEIPNRYDDHGAIIAKSPFQGVFLIKDLDKVKALAEGLGIPFYGVQASSLYQDRVTDFVVASRVGGRSFSPKVAASRLIFEVLAQKAKVIGAELLATGHYAKVVRNKSLDASQVFVSNDLEHDQSYLLASIESDILDKVHLPLSDMRVKEVAKIAESVGLQYIENKGNHTPLMTRPELSGFVSDRIPKKLVKEGNIIDFKNDSLLGDHAGIHNYALGQAGIKTKLGSSLDKSHEVIGFKYAAGIIYVGQREDLRHDLIVLMNTVYSKGVDLSQPFEVFVKNRERGEKVSATLFPRNNGYAEIQFKEKREGLVHQGEYLAFYNRSGNMGRVLGGGEVRTCGYLDFGKLRSFPKKKEEIEEDENRESIDIYNFKF